MCCFTVSSLLIAFSENEVSPGFGKFYSASKYLPGSVSQSLCVAVSCKVRVMIPVWLSGMFHSLNNYFLLSMLEIPDGWKVKVFRTI